MPPFSFGCYTLHMLNQLRDIGLGDNEAKVYIAMLELGPSTVLQIAGKAGINRPTTYVQIESLKQRGLIEHMTKGKKVLLMAKEPSQLEAMLEREAKEIEVQKSELSKVLPQLQTMWDLAGKKPIVRYFEGIEGLRQIQEEFLKCKDKEIRGISSMDYVQNVMAPSSRSSYSERRVARGIRAFGIYSSSGGAVLPRRDDEKLRETKFIDAQKLPFSADITIYDDSIAIASLKGVVSGTIISHPDLAESFRSLHKLLWGLLP